MVHYINNFDTFCNRFYENSFHTISKKATILLGAAELIGAFTCVLLVHKTGKRPLVFTSLIGTGICFCATAFYARYLDVIPGVSVDNIVANHSIPLSERGQFITEKNLTEIIRQYEINGNSSMHETTTLEFESSTAYTTTTEYTDATTAEPQSTTYRSKRMNVPNSYNNSVIDETNLNQVILPIKNANELLWLPLSLLLLGALFAHLVIFLRNIENLFQTNFFIVSGNTNNSMDADWRGVPG